MAKPTYKEAGQAKFQCQDHHRDYVLVWAAGAPQQDVPSCPDGGHPMTQYQGDKLDQGLLEAPAE